MRIISVPGLNGLGMTKGVEKTFEKISKDLDFENIKLNQDNLEEQLNQIIAGSKKYFDFQEKICFFGGDHSISFPLVSNFLSKFEEDSKLLIFDAHPDLMESMQEPTHEEWLRAVVERTDIKKENILIVGIRRNSENIGEKEISYANGNWIKIIYSDEFDSRISEILDFVSIGKIYASFDIDVFDSSIIFSTGYPEKEGLNENQFFNLLEKIKEQIKVFDLVEVNLEKGDEKEKKKTEEIVRKILKTLS